jgi:hypothetical protein
MTEDEKQLNLLSIFYFIVGGLAALGACIPFIHLAIGIAMVSGAIPAPQNGPPIPPALGWFFIGIALLIIVLGWVYAVCMVLAGLRLRRRRGYVFCMVMAGLTCASVPVGTCLGVFTFVVLARPAVKLLFQGRKARIPDMGFV